MTIIEFTYAYFYFLSTLGFLAIAKGETPPELNVFGQEFLLAHSSDSTLDPIEPFEVNTLPRSGADSMFSLVTRQAMRCENPTARTYTLISIRPSSNLLIL